MKLKYQSLLAAILSATSFYSHGAAYEFGRYSYSNLYSPDDKVAVSYSYFNYDIQGNHPTFGSTGDIFNDTNYVQGAVNYFFTEKFSGNAQYYLSNNIDTQHTGGFWQGSSANVKTRTVALTGKYQFSPSFSAFAGPTINQTEINAKFNTNMNGGFGGLDLDLGDDIGFGYTAGASYHIPDMALRATVAYQSAVEHSFDTTESGALIVNKTAGKASSVSSQSEIELPETIDFDFQTGVAENTLMTFSAHWRRWSEHVIKTQVRGEVVTFDRDSVTYALGLARQFTPSFGGGIELNYAEGAGEGNLNPLAPGNGAKGVQLGGKYAFGNTSLFGAAQYKIVKDGKDISGTVYEDNSLYGLTVGVEHKF